MLRSGKCRQISDRPGGNGSTHGRAAGDYEKEDELCHADPVAACDEEQDFETDDYEEYYY